MCLCSLCVCVCVYIHVCIYTDPTLKEIIVLCVVILSLDGSADCHVYKQAALVWMLCNALWGDLDDPLAQGLCAVFASLMRKLIICKTIRLVVETSIV